MLLFASSLLLQWLRSIGEKIAYRSGEIVTKLLHCQRQFNTVPPSLP